MIDSFFFSKSYCVRRLFLLFCGGKSYNTKIDGRTIKLPSNKNSWFEYKVFQAIKSSRGVGVDFPFVGVLAGGVVHHL